MVNIDFNYILLKIKMEFCYIPAIPNVKVAGLGQIFMVCRNNQCGKQIIKWIPSQ